VAKRPVHSRERATTHQGDDAAALKKVIATLPADAPVASVVGAVIDLWADFKSGKKRPRHEAAKIERKRQVRIRKRARAIIDDVRDATRSSVFDKEIIDLAQQIELKGKDTQWYWDEQIRGHSRRGDEDREQLCWCALQIWTRKAGGNLTAWVDKNGNASPAIRFLLAIVERVLGNRTPTPNTARRIIQKEQARREPHQQKNFSVKTLSSKTFTRA